MPAFGLGLGIHHGAKVDPDVASFISRSGITDATQKAAVSTLVRGLKSSGLWTKMVGLYPIVGGTAQAHSQNLRQNLYNITWVNAPTHDAGGVSGNGLTSYGNITGSANTMGHLHHLSTYVRVIPTTAGTDYRDIFGFGNESGSGRYYLIQEVNSDIVNYAGNAIAATVTQSSFILQTRRFNTDFEAYRNGVSYASVGTVDAGPVPTSLNLFVLARNDNGAPSELSDGTMSFFSYGLSLTAGEIVNFNTIVQAFQTSLGRNV